jgi:hypothetical protein
MSLWCSPEPLTLAEWRHIKAAMRHRRFLERLAEVDEGSMDAWLAAVDRDDWTDPYYEPAAPALGVPT